MKLFRGYFENRITFELRNYATHWEDKHSLHIRLTDGTNYILSRIDMKAVYGKEMPIDIVYKCGFIKFDRYEIIEVA